MFLAVLAKGRINMHDKENLIYNWMEYFLDTEEQVATFSLQELNEAYIEMTNFPSIDSEWVEPYLEASGYSIAKIVPFTAEALNQEWHRIYRLNDVALSANYKALKNSVLSRAS
jgi:hypothetical protein